MRIMATGVHHPCVTRAVRDVVLLQDGQRVEIGAKGDNRSIPRRVAGNFRNNSSAIRPQPIANARGCEVLGHKRSRSILIAAQLRRSVQVSSNLENFRLKLRDGTLQMLYEG
jgi:hypothetical protein